MRHFNYIEKIDIIKRTVYVMCFTITIMLMNKLLVLLYLSLRETYSTHLEKTWSKMWRKFGRIVPKDVYKSKSKFLEKKLSYKKDT